MSGVEPSIVAAWRGLCGSRQKETSRQKSPDVSELSFLFALRLLHIQDRFPFGRRRIQCVLGVQTIHCRHDGIQYHVGVLNLVLGSTTYAKQFWNLTRYRVKLP